MWLANLLDINNVWEIHVSGQQKALEWCKVGLLFHSEKFFGLARSDYLDVRGKGWENGEKKK